MSLLWNHLCISLRHGHWEYRGARNNRMSSCRHLSFTYIHALDVIIFLIVHAEINELCIW